MIPLENLKDDDKKGNLKKRYHYLPFSQSTARQNRNFFRNCCYRDEFFTSKNLEENKLSKLIVHNSYFEQQRKDFD